VEGGEEGFYKEGQVEEEDEEADCAAGGVG